MKRLFSLCLCVIMMLTMMPYSVSADTVEPCAYPTISSRFCTRCGETMQKVSTEYEYHRKSIQSILCPNTPYADESSYHTHLYRQQYDVYECPSCGSWGRMFIESILHSCSIVAPDGKKRIA